MTLFSFNRNGSLKNVTPDSMGLTKSAWSNGIQDKYYTTANASIKNNAVVGGLTGIGSYEVVSYVFRCVNILAMEVSNFPRQLQDLAGNDVTEDKRYTDIVPKTDSLFKLDASQSLTGQSYLLINEGRLGGSNLKLKWVATPTIQPWYDPLTRQVMYFKRVLNTAQFNRDIPLDRIIYQWNPNFSDETKPGVGESQVCLGPSSGLYALDTWVANFLNSGGVPVTIFPLLPETSDSDKDEFQKFIDRRLSGVRNVFRTIATRWRSGDWKPFTIGSTLKDVDTAGLTTTRREDIAFAHGMSPNVADGGYKYATADSEYLNFILGTVVPRVERRFECLNEFYNKLGLQLVALPKKHEVIQSAMLVQAQTVQALTGQPVISVNEGREIIELEPVPGGDWPTQEEVDAKKEQEASLAQAQVDALANNDAGTTQPGTVDPDKVKVALGEWRKLARANIKAGGAFVLPSAPNVIPDSLVAPINAALGACKTVGDVNAVFTQHWPKGEPHRSEALELADAIRYAAEVMEASQ